MSIISISVIRVTLVNNDHVLFVIVTRIFDHDIYIVLIIFGELTFYVFETVCSFEMEHDSPKFYYKMRALTKRKFVSKPKTLHRCENVEERFSSFFESSFFLNTIFRRTKLLRFSLP